MKDQEARRTVDQALTMAEKFQDRCHSAEEILAGLVYLPWWRFGERKRLRKKFEEHYNKFVTVSFNEFIEKQ
jgi:hypothetical protein